MTNLDSVLKSRDIILPTGPYSQDYGLLSGHLQLWELDHKEGRAPKNWCLWTVVLEKTPERPLNSMEIKLVNLKGNQPWLLVGRTKAAAAVFWSPGANRQLIGKVPDTGKDWGQKNRVSEDEMVGWHHWCSGHELGQTSGDEWGTRRPGVLQSMGSPSVGHIWVTEQQQSKYFTI